MRGFFVFLTSMGLVFGLRGQTNSSDRLTDWSHAGLKSGVAVPGNLLFFNTGVSDNVTDNAPLLQAFLDNVQAPAIVQIPEGVWRFESEVIVPSGLVMRGMGAGITVLNFDMNGANTPCLRVNGAEITTEHLLSQDAFVGDQTVQFATAPSTISPGDYIRFIQDDETWVNDSWSYRRTGQISRVSSVSTTAVSIESPMRYQHLTGFNARVRKVNPASNVGLECFTLNRVDVATAPAAGVSNIHFRFAVNSWVKGVESFKCNYAHIEVLYSANLQISDNYLHDAFSFGTGGRAYGVMLHFATSECRVENNIFMTLRHAMIMQAGANGNVFAYNHSSNSNNEFNVASSDLVCHGNFVYRNLFEGNIAVGATVDNSHGGNGPYNTFFRNRTSGFATFFGSRGYNVTGNGANHAQNFLGNETASGTTFGDSDHLIDYNSWQSSTGNLAVSLAYQELPKFLADPSFLGIGYGYFGINAQNPASLRFDTPERVFISCGNLVWDGVDWAQNRGPSANSKFFDIQVNKGAVCEVSGSNSVFGVHILPGGRVVVNPSSNLSVLDTVYINSNAQDYGQFLAEMAVPIRYQLTINQPGWHLVGFPFSGGTLADLEDQIKINFDGNQFGSSIYKWEPQQDATNNAEYAAVLNSSAPLGGRAYNLFLDDFLVKPGKGINQDGKLPITLTAKGLAFDANFFQQPLGFGTAPALPSGSQATGWNLLLNPYPSAIDIDEIFKATPSSFEEGIYLYNPALDQYELRTKSTIFPPPSEHSIAPGQAFFIRIDSDAHLPTTFFNFTHQVRTVVEVPPFYNKVYSGFTLNLVNEDNDTVSSARLYLNQEASRHYQPNFDISFFGKSTSSKISFVKMQAEGQHYLSVAAIPSIASRFIDLNFNVNQTGRYKIFIDDQFPEGEIIIQDRRQKEVHDLRMAPFYIDLQKGVDQNHYRIHFVRPNLFGDFSEPKVWHHDGVVTIEFPGFSGLASWQITDLSGRVVASQDLFDFDGYKEELVNLQPTGLYQFVFKTQQGSYATKLPLIK
jgi:hypothetical protein